MSLYDKRDDFPFAIHNYPHLYSNVPCMATYAVFVSQLIRFAKACDTYPDFLTRHQCLVSTIMRQGFKYDMLCRKFKQFYRSHFDLISRYSKSVTQHLRVVSIVRLNEPVVIVAVRAQSSWSNGCLHTPWLSASLIPLSLLLGRSLFYIDFFSSIVHELDFFVCVCVFLSKTCEKSRGMRAC